jgi:hypothetical protein
MAISALKGASIISKIRAAPTEPTLITIPYPPAIVIVFGQAIAFPSVKGTK